MSLVEKAYEKFKNSIEQTKVINEKLYFQIIRVLGSPNK